MVATDSNGYEKRRDSYQGCGVWSTTYGYALRSQKIEEVLITELAGNMALTAINGLLLGSASGKNLMIPGMARVPF